MLDHDAWRYHRTEPRKLFRAGEEVPEGWEPTPDVFACQDMTRAELVEWAAVRGVDVDLRKTKENMIDDIFTALGTYR